MSKVKYYYDPDTLSYRKIETKSSKRIRNIIIFLLPLPLVFLVGIYLGFLYKVPIIEKDIPITKNRLVELSSLIKEVDSVILGAQTHIDQQESFLINQSRIIEFRQRKSEEKLKKTETVQYNIATDINLMKDKITELQLERDSLQIANDIDFEVLAIYERQIRWEKIITGITQNLFFFILGILINYLRNRLFKRKILKEALARAKFDKDAYNVILANEKREKEQLRSNYTTKTTALIVEVGKLKDTLKKVNNDFKNLENEKNQTIITMNSEISELKNLVNELRKNHL